MGTKIQVRKCTRNFNNSGASSPVVVVWVTHTLCVSYFCTSCVGSISRSSKYLASCDLDANFV
jgi:hypothetical protein